MGRQIDFLTRREREERDAMARAANAAVADIHREMAERYAELAREARLEGPSATAPRGAGEAAGNDRHA